MKKYTVKLSTPPVLRMAGKIWKAQTDALTNATGNITTLDLRRVSLIADTVTATVTVTFGVQLVAYYIGASGQFVPTVLRPIYWGGGRTLPPPDVPRCGFDGRRCLQGLRHMLQSQIKNSWFVISKIVKLAQLISPTEDVMFSPASVCHLFVCLSVTRIKWKGLRTIIKKTL